ncbi:MAG TPA: aldolase/citrate lyase family protein [Ilumatobacter sp.]|nr:aldolase/citrate lyase family protein [Ilumatobacter sp.]
MSTATVKDVWRAGRPALGAWLSIPSTVTAEAVARQGFDYVCIDLQHGLIELPAVTAMVQAIELGGGAPIVRVPWNEPGVIGKVLDCGAQGVIVPMVNTAEQAAACVAAARYAPVGGRSWGPALVAPRKGADLAAYREWADANTAVIPMIETPQALANLDAILATPGIDAVYVGPSDLSIGLGWQPANHDGKPEFDDALAAVVAGCRARGIVAGIHSSGALAAKRIAQGFTMMTIASDIAAMRAGLAAELTTARG